MKSRFAEAWCARKRIFKVQLKLSLLETPLRNFSSLEYARERLIRTIVLFLPTNEITAGHDEKNIRTLPFTTRIRADKSLFARYMEQPHASLSRAHTSTLFYGDIPFFEENKRLKHDSSLNSRVECLASWPRVRLEANLTFLRKLYRIR